MTRTLIHGLGYLVFFVWILYATAQGIDDSPCYDDQSVPEMCWPRSENIAFGKTATASNTCGLSEPQEYCVVGIEVSKQQFIIHVLQLTFFTI